MISKFKYKLISKIAHTIGVTDVGLKKYSINSFWLISEKVYNIILALVIGIVVTRHLGPENVGILTYGIAIYAIIFAISTLGLDEFIMKSIVDDRDNAPKILGSVFFLRTVASVILFLSASIYVYLTTSTDKMLPIIIIISASVLLQPIIAIQICFMSDVNNKLKTMAYLIGATITAVIRLTLIFLNADLIYFALAYFFELLIISIVTIILFNRNGYSFDKWIINKEEVVCLLKKAIPLSITMVVYTVFVKIDVLMIEYYLSNEDLGIYSVAVRLMETWMFVPMFISTSFMPSLVDSKAVDHNKYNRRLTQLASLLIWFSLCLGTVTALLSTPIVSILFGEAFIGASSSLAIIIWVILFVSVLQITIKKMIIENNTFGIIVRPVVGLILNISLNMYLIPRYGIKGAAISTTLSYFFIAYIIDLFTKKDRELLSLKLGAMFLPIRYLLRKK